MMVCSPGSSLPGGGLPCELDCAGERRDGCPGTRSVLADLVRGLGGSGVTYVHSRPKRRQMLHSGVFSSHLLATLDDQSVREGSRSRRGEGEEGSWGRGVSEHTSLVVLYKSGSHFGISCGQPWGRGCWFDGLLSTEALSVTFFGQP